MLLILHGDNIVASRNHLNHLIDEAKQKGVAEVVRLEGKTISPTDLIQALETHSLFGSDKLVIIDGLLSRPKSKIKDSLISYLKSIASTSSTSRAILWENKLLTAAGLKSLGSPQDIPFKISKTLWKFLDSLYPGSSPASLNLLKSTLTQEEPEMVFAMLIRQVRLLIGAKDNTLKLPSWQAGRLKSQSARFSQSALISLHQQLLNLDRDNKTGQNLFDLPSSLDILVAKI